jgi:probable FeS assembly SUF system protein SufT
MTRHEPVALKRPVEAVLVPSGERATIPAGEWVTVQQTLGGQFTAMTMRGGIVRIDGHDADALGDSYVEEAKKAQEKTATLNAGAVSEDTVWATLGEVYDPELPVSIVELGLVYYVGVEPHEHGAKVTVKMTLTAPGCGIGDVLLEDVRERLRRMPGVAEADVQMVFDPPWHSGMMTEAARLTLGFY